MRTDRMRFGWEERRQHGVALPPFLSREGEEGGGEKKGGEQGIRRGEKGKQDKGSVSRPCSSVCLHIVFWRGMSFAARDMRLANGANLPFSVYFGETPNAGGPP
jgi:hypothetical protein